MAHSTWTSDLLKDLGCFKCSLFSVFLRSKRQRVLVACFLVAVTVCVGALLRSFALSNST